MYFSGYFRWSWFYLTVFGKYESVKKEEESQVFVEDKVWLFAYIVTDPVCVPFWEVGNVVSIYLVAVNHNLIT